MPLIYLPMIMYAVTVELMFEHWKNPTGPMILAYPESEDDDEITFRTN